MKKISILIASLILLCSLGLSVGAQARTGVHHEVEVTVIRDGIGNLLKAKWMSFEQDMDKWWENLWSKDKSQPKWAS